MVENSYYERKIKYLDLMESGERTGSAGFIKIEVKGMGISLLINVKGLHPTDTYEREVMLQTEEGESSIGRINLKEGQGQFQYHMAMDHYQLRGIRIVLGGTREISCKWQEKKREMPAVKSKMRAETVRENERQENEHQGNEHQGNEYQENEISSPGLELSGQKSEPMKKEKQGSSQKPREIQVIPWDEIKVVEESLEKMEKAMSKPGERGAWEAAEKTIRPAEKTIRPEEKEMRPAEKTIRSVEKTMRPAETAIRPEEKKIRSAEKTMRLAEEITDKTVRSVRRQASGSTLGSAKRPVRLMEDKWQQIWAIYPHIHPFQDEREYLSISPADFVLLPEEAYRAANNSFLLHGYYNYDHLILTKIEKRGEVSYYIGVPGNYYEREKQVAIMFGFESFECGTEPAQAGDFGYYMMRTQL